MRDREEFRATEFLSGSRCPDLVFPTAQQLEPLEALYQQNLFQQAYSAANLLGPLEQWRGTSARLFTGRLARHLGADKLGTRQVLRAWRHDSGSWKARTSLLWTVCSMRGPVAQW